MEKESELRLVRALERLSMILAADLTNKLGDEADLAAKAQRLRKFGFSTDEIASVLNTTQNALRVAKHRRKKSGRSKTKR